MTCVHVQSCPTLCDPVGCSPPGSCVHRISQAKNTGVGCHFLLQGYLLNAGIEPMSLESLALADRFFNCDTWEALFNSLCYTVMLI